MNIEESKCFWNNEYDVYFMLLHDTIGELDTCWKNIKTPFFFHTEEYLQHNISIKHNDNTIVNDIIRGSIIQYHDFLYNKKSWLMKVTNYMSFKFKVMHSVLNNAFFNAEIISKIFEKMGKSQRHYMALCKFLHIIKYKKYKVAVSCDLVTLEPIDITKKTSIAILQNNSLFYFNLKDLIIIINNSLCQCWEDTFVTNPTVPTNPYNKIPFAKHELYKIYMKARYDTHITIPILIELWKCEQFCINVFHKKYSRIIRKEGIRKFVWSSPSKNHIIMEDTMEMLEQNKFTKNWKIHRDFPIELLVNHMRPYLYLFYLINYDTLDVNLEEVYSNVLEEELEKCYRKNSCFGKKKRTFPKSNWKFQNGKLDEYSSKQKPEQMFETTFYPIFSSKSF